MEVSRPLLILLVGVLVLGAFVLVTRAGGADDESATVSTASIAEPKTDPVDASDGREPAGRGTVTRGGVSSSRAQDGQQRVRGRSGSGAKDGEQGVPRQVARALANGKVAVVVLYQPGAADDEATLAAVRGLEQARDGRNDLRSEVDIFTDELANAGSYVGLTVALGVSQVPAIAIVRPNGEARLLEGYQDRRSLRQHLADAL